MVRQVQQRVAVIGLGYVGLPLAMRFANQAATVVGIDIDQDKIAAIQKGHSYISHISSKELTKLVRKKRLSATTNFAAVNDVHAIVVCVPTPLSKNREPAMEYVLQTAERIARYLRRGTVVVLESTTYPGTTDGPFREALETGSGLKAGVDFHLAFSPEREDPGNRASRLEVIPKLVGGLTPRCTKKAASLYRGIVRRVVPVSSCRVAEASKLLENIFRSVNIALVNELKVVYAAMGIDVWEVIEAAKTKPFGFMPFYPGPGLGGHCIPIDPFYLTWKAREFGQNTRFIELAGEVNTAMPSYVVARATEALNSKRLALRGSRILIVGLAYKPDVDDQRESPAFALMDLFKRGGATVDYYDPHVPVIKPTREHPDWTGIKSIAWNRRTVSSYDLAVLCTAHNVVNYDRLAEWSRLVVDTRNVLARVRNPRPEKVWKA